MLCDDGARKATGGRQTLSASAHRTRHDAHAFRIPPVLLPHLTVRKRRGSKSVGCAVGSSLLPLAARWNAQYSHTTSSAPVGHSAIPLLHVLLCIPYPRCWNGRSGGKLPGAPLIAGGHVLLIVSAGVISIIAVGQDVFGEARQCRVEMTMQWDRTAMDGRPCGMLVRVTKPQSCFVECTRCPVPALDMAPHLVCDASQFQCIWILLERTGELSNLLLQVSNRSHSSGRLLDYSRC